MSMEPQIQYVKTSDGVNIAHYAIGNGPPLLNVRASTTRCGCTKYGGGADCP
jgi:hypothetical protein